MQVEGEGVLVMPQYLTLHKALWERQQSALRRAQPDQIAVAETAKEVGVLLLQRLAAVSGDNQQ